MVTTHREHMAIGLHSRFWSLPVWKCEGISWIPSKLPGSSCCLNISLKVQCRSSWQRFIVHIKYLQHNIHTIVQVHIYRAEFSVQIPNQKCSFRSNCKCYLCKSLHCYWMQHALGMFGSPIDECNILLTSLDALDMFDLCLVINCKLCLDLDLDYCLED